MSRIFLERLKIVWRRHLKLRAEAKSVERKERQSNLDCSILLSNVLVEIVLSYFLLLWKVNRIEETLCCHLCEVATMNIGK